MAPEEKQSFWTTLPGILTGLAMLITAVTGLVVAFGWGESDTTESATAVEAAPSVEPSSSPGLEIIEMSSRSPDHVVLKNLGALTLDLSGYLLKEGKHECAIPAGKSLAPDETLTAYFFSEKNAADAASHEAVGDFVCSKTFGIGPQELVQVLTPGRVVISEKRAP